MSSKVAIDNRLKKLETKAFPEGPRKVHLIAIHETDPDAVETAQAKKIAELVAAGELIVREQRPTMADVIFLVPFPPNPEHTARVEAERYGRSFH